MDFKVENFEPKQKLGMHIVAEIYLDNPDVLNDEKRIVDALVDSAVYGNMTVINVSSHKFSPHGVTSLVLLSESHISIHTWPEYGYAAIDIFACGKGDPEKSLEKLKSLLPVKDLKVLKIDRGLF
ncbi:MAG: adenosylmethionine decarboxylase [Candidatus ainarchaeum sp.]|nr:adenosylmethionine decarboxylase [Candidatus ainarchaeum sp.]